VDFEFAKEWVKKNPGGRKETIYISTTGEKLCGCGSSPRMVNKVTRRNHQRRALR